MSGRFRLNGDKLKQSIVELVPDHFETIAMPFSQLASLKTFVAFAVVLSFISIVWAEPPAIVGPPTVLINDHPAVQMREKLQRSKQILDGLIRQDFDSVSRAARELKRIGEATDWPLENDRRFERYTAEFATQCDELDSLAKEMNSQGIQFTFLSMTATCIRCHDHVRDSHRAGSKGRNGDVRLFPSRSPLRDMDHSRKRN